MMLHINPEDFVKINRLEYAEEAELPSISYWQDAGRRLKEDYRVIIALAMLFAIILMCVIGPHLSAYGYEELDMGAKNQSPSLAHWFGTDKMGRDIFVRVWIGGRISLFLGLVGAVIDLVVGLIFGGISAYAGGRVDTFMMRVLEIISGIPYLVLVIVVSLIVGGGVVGLLIAMTLSGWCYTARMVRGQIMQIRNKDYVLAAKLLGVPPIKIFSRHIFPNILGVLIVTVSLDIPSFIFGEAFLSYIGLGISPPLTSWGALAAGAQQQMHFYPYQLFFPALLISLTMLSFQLLGDGLRDALDPSLRK